MSDVRSFPEIGVVLGSTFFLTGGKGASREKSFAIE